MGGALRPGRSQATAFRSGGANRQYDAMERLVAVDGQSVTYDVMGTRSPPDATGAGPLCLERPGPTRRSARRRHGGPLPLRCLGRRIEKTSGHEDVLRLGRVATCSRRRQEGPAGFRRREPPLPPRDVPPVACAWMVVCSTCTGTGRNPQGGYGRSGPARVEARLTALGTARTRQHRWTAPGGCRTSSTTRRRASTTMSPATTTRVGLLSESRSLRTGAEAQPLPLRPRRSCKQGRPDGEIIPILIAIGVGMAIGAACGCRRGCT